MFIFTWRSSWKEKWIISCQNNLKVHKMTKNKKYIGYWPFILAKNTTGWILGFYIAGLANNKKLSACPACTSCIKVCGYYFLIFFFFKDFCCVIYINIFCVLFTINITFYRCFILSDFIYRMIPFFFNEPGSRYLISYFQSLQNLKFMEVKSKKYLTAYVI